MKTITNFFLSISITAMPFVVCYGTTTTTTTKIAADHQQQHNYMNTNTEHLIADELLSENKNQQDTRQSVPCDDTTATSSASLLSASSAALFDQANAQLRALNENPFYQNMKNFDDIAESIAENRLKGQMLQGKIDIVSPNNLKQTSFLRSIMIPKRINNHQIVATYPLQPIVITQPAAPTAHIYSGPPTVIKAMPVVYKLKPSVIYQQEIINKIPAPLSLNPVYVKVYKPSKQVNVPSQMLQSDDIFSTTSFHQYNQNKYVQDSLQSTDYTMERYVPPLSTNTYQMSY